MNRIPRRSERGFTLLEVMIVTAVLSVVTMSLIMYLSALNDAVSGETLQGTLETNANRFVMTLADQLTDAYFTYPPPEVTLPSPQYTRPYKTYYVQFKNPVDIDGNGSVLDSNGNVEFGINIAGVGGNGWSYYYLASEPNVNRRIIRESILKQDLNGDGDKYDYFYRYRIMRYHYRTSPYLYRRDRVLDIILGDFDGDGSWDPIYTFESSNLITISVWMFGQDINGRPIMVNARTQVLPRNQWKSLIS